jgi:hypothetical protein
MGRPPKKVNNNMVEDDSSTIDLASDINSFLNYTIYISYEFWKK